MKKLIIPVMTLALLATSCVSKKKYVELETKYNDTRGTLQKTTLEKEELESKFAKIETRVVSYNQKINSLKSDNVTLQNENDVKLDIVGNTAVISNNARERMNEILTKVDPAKLAKAETLKDSLNLAVSYNLMNSVGLSDIKNSEDIDINIDETVVMISVSDKLLFNTASYKVKRSAYKLITQLADIIETEPSIDVMIEGHTDSRSINNSVVEDNWDLSVKRATSIVRLLQDKFNIDGSRLIASGRGDTVPLVANTSSANRAKNRRTRIVILPNLDKFFALLTNDGVIEKN